MATLDIALQLALLLLMGAFCQWLAWRMKLPAILPLLLLGLVLGPVSGLLDPDALMGDLLFPFVSIGVAIILVEGSLTLRFSDARNVQKIIRNLTTVGVLVTWGIMGAAAHYIAGLDWSLALLFGALVTVTGPTVIVPMLRSVRPASRVANILRWEGILVDPIGAVLAVLVFEYLVTGHESESLLEFAKVIAIGTAWGLAGGFGLGALLKRHV
ncbi:MAG: cation:proton antiporter, partial [Xanthomonadales bacterium]|nr:cation:proton antiporter [Xanthomonadales bacterium]